MANEPLITVVGNLTGDPELRFTPSGAAVANFTVASTPRTKDGDQWVDGQPLFLGCSVWREYAENVAESLQKGMRVVVQGRLKARSYETKDGEKRTVFELDVDEVAPSLRYATARVTKTERNGNGAGQSRAQDRQQPASDPWAKPAGGAADPWATPSTSDEPPF